MYSKEGGQVHQEQEPLQHGGHRPTSIEGEFNFDLVLRSGLVSDSHLQRMQTGSVQFRLPWQRVERLSLTGESASPPRSVANPSLEKYKVAKNEIQLNGPRSEVLDRVRWQKGSRS